MDIEAALTESWASIIALLEGLDQEGWASDTSCAGWTVHDVAAHLGHLEGLPVGFEQPEPPSDFDAAVFTGIDVVTETGVASRRSWSDKEVLDEVRRASAATLDLVSGLDREGWEQPFPSPVGLLPMHQTQEIRVADAYVHLLDMRYGLGRPLRVDDEPVTAALVIGRAIRLSGWGAVKAAGLPDGTRIRLDLSGPGGTIADLVVDRGRGSLVEPLTDPQDRIAGSGLAYLLAVAGRAGMSEVAGGLDVDGPAAAQLLEGYRLFL